MNSIHKTQVSVDSILLDPLIKSLPAPPSRALVARELRDPRLRQFNLDALAEMDFEDVVHNLYVDSGHTEDEDVEDDTDGSPISITLDSLAVKAVITLHQVPGQPGPTETQLRQALDERGITWGIREEFILRLAEHPIYNQRFRIAEGILPLNGTDGGAIFHFDANKSLSLDASTATPDFKSIDFAEYVHEGDLLCELTPPTAGQPGRGVRGEALQGAMGTVSPIKPGTNATLSEDGTKIYAACDGQVFFKKNRVGVSRVMVLDQVDQSTGNILFVGSVLIRGDVEDGRVVQAGGNVTVCGHVKNAKLAAGRNLVLVNGITGDGEGLLSAEGSIRARFIEQAKVKVGGDLYSDSILNAKIECGGSVYLDGRRGRLVGGTCTVGQSLTAHEIGNRAGIRTSVILKPENAANALLERQVQLSRYQNSYDMLENIAKSITFTQNPRSDQLAALVRAVYILRQLEKETRTIRDELAGRSRGLMSSRKITATEDLYPDVHLEICGVSLDTDLEYGPCVVTSTGERLIITGLSCPLPSQPNLQEGSE